MRTRSGIGPRTGSGTRSGIFSGIRPGAGLPAGWAGLGVLTTAGFLSLWLAPPPPGELWVITALMIGAAFAAATGVVTARRPVRPVSAVSRLLAVSAVMLLSVPPVFAVGARTAAVALAAFAAAVVVPFVGLRVTEARPASRLLRPVEIAVAVTGTACAAAFAARTFFAAGPSPAGDVMQVTTSVTTVASAAVVFLSGWVLFDGTSGDDRRRVLWVILGSSTALVVTLLFLFVSDYAPIGPLGVVVTMGALIALVPLSVTVALVAPRRADVRGVIRGAIVLLVMVCLTAAVYEGVEALWELLAGAPPGKGVRALLAAAIAAGYHPVRLRVQVAMDEMLFGHSADPVETLTRLGTQLTAGAPPLLWLDTLRTTLAVPGIGLRQDGTLIAVSGSVDGRDTTATPLQVGSEHVGDLVVTLPAEHLRLPAAATTVLALVAGPLAQALHAVRLSEQLRLSRGLVVTALEEERRRMRRDLHDGLGPTLTGIAYSADATANFLTADPDLATRTLRQLRVDAGDAIAEVRRIVYGLRPKALDELGLVGAVRQRVTPLRSAGGEPLVVTIDAPAALPPLPAAVEVVAYRVAVEAVTNVARHADVTLATVTLTVTDAPSLHLSVQDAGCSTEPWTPGVGLQSMRERVEQIGGALTVHATPQGATVTADLPLVIPT